MVEDSARGNLDLPDGFKLTELGPLPEEWEVVRLGELVDFTSKPRSLNTKGYREIPFISMEFIPHDGTVSPTTYVSKAGNSITSGVYCEPGDILFAKITPSLENGKQCIVPDVKTKFAYATTEVYALKPKLDLIVRYYLFILLRHQGIREELAAKMEGSTGRQRLPKHVLEHFLIPLPPLPEQRAIAQVLRTVQRAKEATKRVIDSMRELKKSLMCHLFTYGLVPLDQADQVPLKETEIGPVPEHWKVVPVGQVGKIVTGTTPRTSMKQFYNGPYPFIAPGDMGESRYVWRTTKTLSRGGLKVSRVIPKGSVVVVCIGATIGKVALTTAEESTTNQQINTIIPNNDLALAEYLHDALFYRAPDLPSLAGRAAVPIVNKSVFASFLIPLPPLPEQREIARILQAADCKIEAEENRKQALDTLFKSLLHHLMTAKIRVPVEYLKHFNSNIGGSGVRGLGADAAEEVGS